MGSSKRGLCTSGNCVGERTLCGGMRSLCGVAPRALHPNTIPVPWPTQRGVRNPNLNSLVTTLPSPLPRPAPRDGAASCPAVLLRDVVAASCWLSELLSWRCWFAIKLSFAFVWSLHTHPQSTKQLQRSRSYHIGDEAGRQEHKNVNKKILLHHAAGCGCVWVECVEMMNDFPLLFRCFSFLFYSLFPDVCWLWFRGCVIRAFPCCFTFLCCVSEQYPAIIASVVFCCEKLVWRNRS